MEIDDDLPPPPPQRAAIVLDDSDDDLPPPPTKPTQPAAAPRGIPINLDDDDDLPPPPPKQQVAIDDDLDVPPPKPQALGASVASPLAAASPAAAPTPLKATPVVSSASPAAAHDDPMSPASSTRKRGATVRVSVYREGYLLKQQPAWPYSSQKRWCVLDGKKFSYFEAQESAGSKPLGTLDLKGARLNLELGAAGKMPNSFGLVMDIDPHAGENGLSKVLTLGGVLQQEPKSRTYVFSTLTRDDYEDWTKTIQSVVSGRREMELHWFEKMAQGIF